MSPKRLTREEVSKHQNQTGDTIQHDIALEDLHPTYQVFAALVGIENALVIGKELGGANIYLPKLSVEQVRSRKDRNRRIGEEFNGHNYAELARKYNLTDITVRDILKREP